MTLTTLTRRALRGSSLALILGGLLLATAPADAAATASKIGYPCRVQFYPKYKTVGFHLYTQPECQGSYLTYYFAYDKVVSGVTPYTTDGLLMLWKTLVIAVSSGVRIQAHTPADAPNVVSSVGFGVQAVDPWKPAQQR